VMKLDSTVNKIVKLSSRFDLGKKHSQTPIQFHYYLEQVDLPITINAMLMFLKADDKNQAITKLNCPARNLNHKFIDLNRCIGNLCFIIPYELQNPVVQTPCMLLVKNKVVQIDYDEQDEDVDTIIQRKEKAVEHIK